MNCLIVSGGSELPVNCVRVTFKVFFVGDSVNVAESQREALPKFDAKGDQSTVAQRWKRWKLAFELYVKAQAFTDGARQKALLLNCWGMDLQDVFYALEAEGDADTYVQCVKTLDAHFLPQKT